MPEVAADTPMLLAFDFDLIRLSSAYRTTLISIRSVHPCAGISCDAYPPCLRAPSADAACPDAERKMAVAMLSADMFTPRLLLADAVSAECKTTKTRRAPTLIHYTMRKTLRARYAGAER